MSDLTLIYHNQKGVKTIAAALTSADLDRPISSFLSEEDICELKGLEPPPPNKAIEVMKEGYSIGTTFYKAAAVAISDAATGAKEKTLNIAAKAKESEARYDKESAKEKEKRIMREKIQKETNELMALRLAEVGLA